MPPEVVVMPEIEDKVKSIKIGLLKITAQGYSYNKYHVPKDTTVLEVKLFFLNEEQRKVCKAKLGTAGIDCFVPDDLRLVDGDELTFEYTE
jgi:hypothetical protein